MGTSLPSIISPYQSGFIKGRNITDNILLAQELIQDLNKKCRGNNMAIKLDMSKAYDKVNWLFLLKTLRAFGFSEIFIDIIWRNISNISYSMIINGASHGYFKAHKGLRQGDPLSPALFIINAEVLARNLQQAMIEKRIGHFTQPIGTEIISHLSFADDIVIFCNGAKKSMEGLMGILREYQDNSGQLLNNSKCKYMASKHFTIQNHARVKEITGFTKQELPFTYLGCPIFIGRAKSSYFENMVNSIKEKVAGWKTNLLNQAGRIILIQHVLLSMPMHILSCVPPPPKVNPI